VNLESIPVRGTIAGRRKGPLLSLLGEKGEEKQEHGGKRLGREAPIPPSQVDD